MKVLHIITTIDRGGAENHLYSLICGQVAAGTRVSVAYLKGQGHQLEVYRTLGVPTHDLGMRYYGSLAPLLRLRQVIGREAPDLVHAHLPPAELYGRLALLGFSVPFVVSKHNDNPFYRGIWSSLLSAWVARRAVRVIAISSAVAYYMAAQQGIPRVKLEVIHYGMRPDEATSEAAARVREQWGCSGTEFLIGFVGRLVPQKAVHVLIEAYRRYRKAAAVPSRLCIVGQGPLENALRAQAMAAGIAEHVIWAGFRSDVGAVMKALDVLVLCSVHEGFGLVLLEAMSAGRPVVATRISAIPEIVVDGETGRLVPVSDPATLALALTELEDSGARAAMGQAGRVRLEAVFPETSMIARTLDVYREALQGGTT